MTGVVVADQEHLALGGQEYRVEVKGRTVGVAQDIVIALIARAADLEKLAHHARLLFLRIR